MAETPDVLLENWVLAQSGDTKDWVRDQLALLSDGAKESDLHIFLGLAPRKLGKADLVLTEADKSAADAAHPGWTPQGWSIDGAARVLGLLRFAGSRPFAEMFKDLRRTADAAEMIALYRGMPLYPEPDALEFEVGEGLRSNLKPVFEALSHNNPYPRDIFDEHRWNHMILKALFVDSELSPITGLRERANPELARILINTAQERWAAGRPVSPELWIAVKPFRNTPSVSGSLDEAIANGHLTEEMLK